MFCAIVLAAGVGRRLNFIKKQFLKLNGRMIIDFSVNAFLEAGAAEIVIATNSSHLNEVRACFANDKIKVVAGGATRQQSAKNAFLNCSKNNNLVLIHDAARPFIQASSIKKLVHIAKKTKAATLASFATDTIKLVENKKVKTTLNRENIALIQTPQAFNFQLYEKAVKFAEKNHFNFTDDCQLVEKLGVPVTIVENSNLNLKITTPFDLQIAEFLASKLNL